MRHKRIKLFLVGLGILATVSVCYNQSIKSTDFGYNQSIGSKV